MLGFASLSSASCLSSGVAASTLVANVIHATLKK